MSRLGTSPDSARSNARALSAAHWRDLFDALEHCATLVPRYRGIARPAAGPDLEAASREALARFPMLTKADLKQSFPAGFVPDDKKLGELLRDGTISFVGTSGTTEERVQVLWHDPWWTAQERDGFALHPLTDACAARDDYREAILTTPVCSGNLCHVKALPMHERVVDGAMLFLNQTADPGMWSDADILRMADELDEFRPHAIECDPAYLAYFATRALRLGRRPYQPAFIDHSYEFPSRLHLRAIARAFDVPILDAYGSTECGFAFMQCEHGRYHHNLGWTHAEVLPLALGTGTDRAGLLVLTTLRNPYLNLVRFRTGDLVRIAREPCSCGRNDGLVLDALLGRNSDLLIATDGRIVTCHDVDQVMATLRGALNYRLRQTATDSFQLDVLPDEHEPLDLARAAENLRALLGTAPRARAVSSLPVEASGKFRLCAATHEDVARRLAP